jgi:hypothetical protein
MGRRMSTDMNAATGVRALFSCAPGLGHFDPLHPPARCPADGSVPSGPGSGSRAKSGPANARSLKKRPRLAERPNTP